MSRDLTLALDILLAAQDALEFVRECDAERFRESRLHQNAVIRCLEVMGEAAGRVSSTFRTEHPDVPWRLMADMRNRLIHGYADVDLDLVWTVVRDHLPQLLVILRVIVPADRGEDGTAT